MRLHITNLVLLLLLAIYQCNANCSSFVFQFDVSSIPHPSKFHKGGEDAYLATPSLLALADGVGSWGKKGIDPGLYSRQLMQLSLEFFDQNPAKYCMNPRILINDVHNGNEELGSATYVNAALNGSDINLCNLGDSGLLIVRLYEVPVIVFKTAETQHRFNAPYQLSKNGRDSAADAVCLSLEVEESDIIIMGSDGIFDNLWNREILDLCSKAIQDGTLLDGLALSIAEAAIRRGYDQNARTPFQVHAEEASKNHIGGKLDDSTVIVAVISMSDKI